MKIYYHKKFCANSTCSSYAVEDEALVLKSYEQLAVQFISTFYLNCDADWMEFIFQRENGRH